MAASSHIRVAIHSPNPVCCWCSARQTTSELLRHKKPSAKRCITQGYVKKKAEAEERWQAKARDIKEGKKKSMLSILEGRGLINAISGKRNTLDRLMTDKRIGAYVGIDPTAPSLHVGHLLPLMSLFWLYVHGYHSVSLLGGATAKVGDPTGRTTSREKQQSSVQKINMVSMHYQLKKLWVNVEQQTRKYGYVWEWAWHRELVNNNAWMNKLPIMEVLQLLGAGVRLGPMLGRDTVRNKMETGDGMSFAEFTYPLLQAWDWWHMYQTKGIQVQIGGSDQFGNIIAGGDAIKFISKNHHDPKVRRTLCLPDEPFGFTVPLLTTTSGAKFGKSAGNAVWLDKDMTSTFNLYQFFLRTADGDVERYLKLFTFIPLSQIDNIVQDHIKDPSKRKAQHVLARELVELIHGEREAKETESQHRLLFRSSSHAASTDPTDSEVDVSPSLNPQAAQTAQNNAPSPNVTLPESLVIDQPIARVLHSAGLVSSRSEGHRLAQKQGAYIGSKAGNTGRMGDDLSFTPVKLLDPKHTKDYILEGNVLILRVGKWKVKIVQIVSDDEFERSGLDAPGWREDQMTPRKNR
ncbi:MAG: tyrosyl-tRNA synthetase [Pycnora praestabilis]|nr:MAG: tyrosyl-tRNA synthetase [Pycnora praestabilis]